MGVNMSFSEYFDNTEGTGVLATSDSEGNVDLAVYARPHVEDDETVVLVMADKLSYTNLQQNPSAAYMFIEKTDLPGVKIHLDEEGRCPFVTPEGCTIYSERPSACRYYPIGMANFHEGGEEGIESERFFFVVKEEHCKGHEEDKEWTIRDWRADQGVDLCDEMNREWLEIVMRRKSFGFQATMSEEAKKIFFMVSTDLDKFKKFIFKSSFLDTYEVDQETLDKINEDDIELLKFSYKYLASSLFGTQDIKIKEEKIKARAEKMKKEQAGFEDRADETYKVLKAERDRMMGELKK